MRKLDKILLSIVLLIGLFFSICVVSMFFSIPFIYDAIGVGRFPWLNYALAGYSVIMCLCLFVLLLITLFSPSRSDFLIFAKDKGELQFSKKAIESTARYSFADLDGISVLEFKMKIGRTPEKSRIYVKLSVNGAAGLASLTETVQDRIASAVQSSFGIALKSITIRVTESVPSNADKEASKTDNAENKISEDSAGNNAEMEISENNSGEDDAESEIGAGDAGENNAEKEISEDNGEDSTEMEIEEESPEDDG